MKLQQASIQVFRQLIEVTDQLTQDEYTHSLEILFNSSIGKHVRHIVEFYNLLFAGADSRLVNYDRRGHDKELENTKVLAQLKMQALLRQILDTKQDKRLILSAAYSDSEEDGVFIQTTFYRELLYNIEHAIHHMAIIRIALEQQFPHIVIPENFGVAYSTVRHQKQALKAG
jgi:uncharacterized damage-inducible protein DinB